MRVAEIAKAREEKTRWRKIQVKTARLQAPTLRLSQGVAIPGMDAMSDTWCLESARGTTTRQSRDNKPESAPSCRA